MAIDDILPTVGGDSGPREVVPVMVVSPNGEASALFSTLEESAIRDGRGFTAATGIQSVVSGNVFIATLKNPSPSTRRIILKRRKFGNDLEANSTPLEYIAYGNPTYEPANVGAGLNLKGTTPFSNSEFKWEVRSIVNLDMGGQLGTGQILPRGLPYERTLDFILGPNSGVGFVIQGQGQNIGQATRISIILEWYEEDI